MKPAGACSSFRGQPSVRRSLRPLSLGSRPKFGRKNRRKQPQQNQGEEMGEKQDGKGKRSRAPNTFWHPCYGYFGFALVCLLCAKKNGKNSQSSSERNQDTTKILEMSRWNSFHRVALISWTNHKKLFKIIFADNQLLFLVSSDYLWKILPEKSSDFFLALLSTLRSLMGSPKS